MSIKIDNIIKNDLNSLAVLYKQLSNSETNTGRMNEVFQEIENDKNHVLIGAKINGVLAGSLMAIICKDLVKDCRPFIVIENVIVDEAFRNQHVGGMLMNYIEDYAKQLDCYYIIFVSRFEKCDAHAFYNSLG